MTVSLRSQRRTWKISLGYVRKLPFPWDAHETTPIFLALCSPLIFALGRLLCWVWMEMMWPFSLRVTNHCSCAHGHCWQPPLLPENQQ